MRLGCYDGYIESRRKIESETSSIVYHRLIYSTQSVGAMLWLMAQLRRGQLRMVVDVVGSC